MANKTFKKLTKVVGGVSYDTAVEVANRDIEGNVISSTYAKKNDLNNVIIDLGTLSDTGTIVATTLQKIKDALTSNKSITFEFIFNNIPVYATNYINFKPDDPKNNILFLNMIISGDLAISGKTALSTLGINLITGKYSIQLDQLLTNIDMTLVDLGEFNQGLGVISDDLVNKVNKALTEYQIVIFQFTVSGLPVKLSSISYVGIANTELYLNASTTVSGLQVIGLTLDLQNKYYSLIAFDVNLDPLINLGELQVTGILNSAIVNEIEDIYNATDHKANFKFSLTTTPEIKRYFSSNYFIYPDDVDAKPYKIVINYSKNNALNQESEFAYYQNDNIQITIYLNSQDYPSGTYFVEHLNPTTILQIDLGNFTSLPVSSSKSNIYDVLMDNDVMPIITYTLNNVEHYVYNKVYDTTNGYTFYEPLENNKIRLIVIHSSNNFQIFEEENSSIYISDIGTITNINTHTPAYNLSSDEKSNIDTAYNNNKIVYIKFNYTNENNETETVILPIESKVALTGGAYTYYGGGTLQNHEVWSFYISATSVFVNNITNTHRTKLFNLGTLSQLTGTLSNATEIVNAFNSGYTPIIKFTYKGTTYYFTEPSGTYNSSSNTGSLNWISILGDKTIEKFILNFPSGNYILSNEELGGGETLFEVIDLTSETTYKSISAIYNYLKNNIITTYYPITFDTNYYNAINTAISGGKIPILKFTDGYGYYQNNNIRFAFNLNYNESTEKMGHQMQLIIGDDTGAFCGYKDIKQIPYTWVKETGFSGESGTLTTTEVQSLLATFTQAIAEGTVINAIQDVPNGKLYIIDSSALTDTEATLTGHIFLQSGSNLSLINNLTITIDMITFTGTWTINAFSFNQNNINIGTISLNGGTLETNIITQITRVFTRNQVVFQLEFSIGNEKYRASIAHYDNASTYTFYAFDIDTNLITYKLSVNSTTNQYTLTKITTAESPKAYQVNIDFTNFSEGQTTTLNDTYKNTLERARVNGASVVYDSVLETYYRLLYTEISTNLTLLYSTLDNELGIIEVNTSTGVATVKKVFKTGKNSTINLDTITNNKTNYDNIFNYLIEQGFARAYFNVEGFLDQANSIGNEEYYEAYLSGENKYFASCGKIYQYIVDTSTQGFHVELVGNSLFRPISKNALRFVSSEFLRVSPNSTLTNVSILLGANVSKGQRKYTFDNPKMNFQFRPSFDNSFTFDSSTNELDIRESIYTKLFTWSDQTNTVVPTVSSTRVSTWYPTNWHKGTVTSKQINATILDFSNLPSGITYDEFFRGFDVFPPAIFYNFNNLAEKYQEYRTFRFSLRFVFNYQGVKVSATDKSYRKKWTGTLQNKYLEVIARLDFTNKQVVIYQRIRKFA